MIIKGAGEKAFCAGGDIRGIYGRQSNSLFFLFTLKWIHWSNRSGIDTEMQNIFSQLSQKLEKQAILSLKTSSVRNIFLTTLLVCFLTSVAIFED